MAKGKGKPKSDTPAKESVKSKKPKFKGINHPKNCHKGFRTHGNKELMRAFLGK